MSEIKVNKITPRTGTTITLGDSGDSLSIASGVALTDFTSTGIDDNATSTALTIDSSENVLIDKTSSNYQTTGHELRAGGRAFHTADGGKSLSLVRLTDDGPIMDLYNSSGNEIGQIGVDFTDNLFISGNSTHAGLNFGTASVVPYKNGANLDATIDWGSSATRFKDLYLSGSAYLGGTGSANALDDYEEGTFTVGTYGDATGVLSSESGEYTKIGNVVHVRIVMTVSTNFTGTAIDGLPFTADHSTLASSILATNAFLTLSNINGVIFGKVPDGGSRIEMCENNNFNDAHSPNTSNSTYRISLWYYSV